MTERINEKRPWTFCALGTLFGAYLLFLYGPMFVIYVLSFQGPNGGVTFPVAGTSVVWFQEVFQPGQMANIPVSFSRSLSLAAVVSVLTVVISVAAGLSFQFLGWQPSLFTSALGAQLTWTLPFGLFAMFAVVNRFNRSWEEAATDLGAKAWQRLRYITIPILLPGIIGVAMGAFTLTYDEYARTTLTIGPQNTLPLEIYALISSATSPTLFAIGTLTTGVSFLAIIVSLLLVLRMQRRRALIKAG